jgi:Na+/serine symporter
MLSKTKYALLCLLGMEIFYVLCIIYGVLLSGKAMELHHALVELIPGFVWGDPVSMVWGAAYMGVLAWIVGWYIAWMHNASIITSGK